MFMDNENLVVYMSDKYHDPSLWLPIKNLTRVKWSDTNDQDCYVLQNIYTKVMYKQVTYVWYLVFTDNRFS